MAQDLRTEGQRAKGGIAWTWVDRSSGHWQCLIACAAGERFLWTKNLRTTRDARARVQSLRSGWASTASLRDVRLSRLVVRSAPRAALPRVCEPVWGCPRPGCRCRHRSWHRAAELRPGQSRHCHVHSACGLHCSSENAQSVAVSADACLESWVAAAFCRLDVHAEPGNLVSSDSEAVSGRPLQAVFAQVHDTSDPRLPGDVAS